LKKGVKTLKEIKKALPKEIVRSIELRVGRASYKMTNVSVVLNAMMRMGTVTSEKDVETLRLTEANRYMLLQEIYPKLDLNSVGSEDAKAILVRCYIKAFGPVTEEDITWWTGFSKADTTRALAALKQELRRVGIGGVEREYLILETDYEQFLKFKPAECRFLLLLPYEDPYTKGYRLRDRFVDRRLEKRVYIGGGVEPTILLNGKIIGTWNRSIEEGKEPVKLRFFEHFEKEVGEEAIQKAEAVGRLMADQEVVVEIERDENTWTL